MPRSSSRASVPAALSFMRLSWARLSTSGAPRTPPGTLGQVPRLENLLVGDGADRAVILFLQQPVLEQIADAVLPALVGVAADVDAAGEHLLAGGRVADHDVEVEHEVADLLHPADQGELRVQSLGDPDLAAVAAPQHAGRVDLVRDGRGIDQGKAPGFLKALAQLRLDHAQTRLILRIDALHLALQAGVDQLEVEHRQTRRPRAGRD